MKHVLCAVMTAALSLFVYAQGHDSGITIRGGDRTIKFRFHLTDKVPGFIPLHADTDWHEEGGSEVLWSAIAKGVLSTNKGDDVVLIVREPGVFRVAAFTSNGKKILSTMVTLTVVEDVVEKESPK